MAIYSCHREGDPREEEISIEMGAVKKRSKYFEKKSNDVDLFSFTVKILEMRKRLSPMFLVWGGEAIPPVQKYRHRSKVMKTKITDSTLNMLSYGRL